MPREVMVVGPRALSRWGLLEFKETARAEDEGLKEELEQAMQWEEETAWMRAESRVNRTCARRGLQRLPPW
eukprot:2797894-Pyramimonas_sp.AAC.1